MYHVIAVCRCASIAVVVALLAMLCGGALYYEPVYRYIRVNSRLLSIKVLINVISKMVGFNCASFAANVVFI